jgi:hypothetical protein
VRVFFYTFDSEMEEAINLLDNIAAFLKPDEVWKRVFLDKTLQNTIIVEYIQQDQLLSEGVDETGNPLRNKDNGRTTYSAATEMLSNGRKLEGEPYNLLDSGDFYRSMVFLLGKDFFEIDADPIKGNDNLFTKFGEGIIGLTEESKTKLQVELLERYDKEIRRILSEY